MNYHEMIAAMGEGAAHPGGYKGTLAFLDVVDIPPGLRVLEVGCGTGRTACLLAQKGAKVTAMDRSSTMVGKAKKRAEMQGIDIDVVQGDVCSIPFEADTFDVVFAESVTIFTDPAAAFREYCRVLRTGGRLWDRELYEAAPHPELYPEMFKLYGNPQLPELDAWIGLMRSAGFRNVRPWKPDAASLIPADSDGEFLYDPYQLFDLETLQDPDTLGFFAQNHAFLLEFHEHLSFCVFMGEK